MIASVEQRGNHHPISLWENLIATGAVSETELRLPPDIDYDQYEALAVMLGRVKRSTSWLIGDLILYGESSYGEKYSQAVSLTGLAPSTCANYASICKHIPPSLRRPGVSFSLHQEVAYLPPQEQKKWLDLAEQEEWTKEQLRQAIRGGESDPLGDLAVNGQELESALTLESEEHPARVPAVSNLLGEPVTGPIHIESVAVQIATALAHVPDVQRPIIVEHLRIEIKGKVQELIDDDYY